MPRAARRRLRRRPSPRASSRRACRSYVCLFQYRAEDDRKLRVAVEGARAVVVCDAFPARLFAVEHVEFVERLDVVADEAQGDDDDAAHALAAEATEFVLRVRL